MLDCAICLGGLANRGFARERDRERVMGEWIPGDRSLDDRGASASASLCLCFCACGVAMILGGEGDIFRMGGGEEEVKSITICCFAARL